jgi:hypothetical protein
MNLNSQAVTFLSLVGAQLVGTVTFVSIYRRSNWKATAVGRHLMSYSVAAGGIDLSWALLLIVQWPWLVYLLFATQAAFTALIWQRVYLVWQAQHPAVEEDEPV